MIPVVVLTGFLGSGKTTLLNRWLTLGAGRAPGGGRLALVVNELGAVGIDGDLLPAGLTRQVELPGGCVCCQLDEDLVATLGELASPTSSPSFPAGYAGAADDRDLELIIIETTGIADPLPIGWTLARPPLDRLIRLAAVVTVVDSALHASNRTSSPAVDAQVDGADVLVLGKVDLAGAVGIGDLLPLLRARNDDSPILTGSLDENAAELWSLFDDPPLAGSRVSQSPTRPHSAHGHPFESIALPIDGTLDFEELSAALEALPASVIRVKGIARVIDRSTGSDEEREVAFHRVGARVSCEPITGSVGHRMVAIGRGLDRDQLAACLQSAMVR